MREELLQALSAITEEEARLLQGQSVDKAQYAAGSSFLVDSARLLSKGRLIAIRPHTRFASFPRHSHNYVEIMYMCAGTTTHQINGGEPLKLGAGELLFLSPHASHAIEQAGEHDIAVNFIILPPFFDAALEMIGADNVLSRFLLGALGSGGDELSWLHCRVAAVLPIQNLLESMVWSLLREEPNARRTNQVSMGLLLLHLLNHPETMAVQSSGRWSSPVVLAALAEIEENYQNASLSAVAERFGVSLAYLSAQVHKAVGKTFKELLRQRRLDKAQRLLRDSALPIQDIIAAVGYDNTSYFYRIFREQFGVSPKEYRKKL